MQDVIGKDPEMHGAALVTAIFGSDKTTVSVATGQNEYYPLYMTNGGVTNSVRCAHRNAITLIGFLAIPKCMFACSALVRSSANRITFSNRVTLPKRRGVQEIPV